jgi:hypothetical protein
MLAVGSVSVLATTVGLVSAADHSSPIDLTVEEIRIVMQRAFDADAGADAQAPLILTSDEIIFLEDNLFLPGSGAKLAENDPIRDR